jgi:hypothetical protein
MTPCFQRHSCNVKYLTGAAAGHVITTAHHSGNIPQQQTRLWGGDRTSLLRSSSMNRAGCSIGFNRFEIAGREVLSNAASLGISAGFYTGVEDLELAEPAI